MPKVSIVVPIYNVEKYLAQCLESLVNQTFKDIEILAINDGSTDQSQRIVDEYVKKYDFVKSYVKENGGLSDARNFGMKKVTGKYIAFIDSDDLIEENAIELMYNKAEKDELDIVISDMEEFYEDGRRNIKKEIDTTINNIQKAYMIAMPGFCNRLFRLEYFKKIKFEFIKGIYYEDLAIQPIVAVQTDKIGYIDKPLYKYRIRAGSIMKQQKKTDKLLDIFKVFDYIENGMSKLDNAKDFEFELEYIYIEHLLHAASLRFIPFGDEDDKILKIADIMKEKFPKWRKNKYYKKQSWKYKIVCNLIYLRKLNLLRKVLK